MTAFKPAANQYPGYFQGYVDQVKEDELFKAFGNQAIQAADLLESISALQSQNAYAPGKWTIRELLQHIIDTERIFAYRAVCFARGEQQQLPGFEEDDYAALSAANDRNWSDIVEEFKINRQSIECLYRSFSTAALQREGIANGSRNSVTNIGFILIGHFNHHRRIIEERYLTA